MNNNEAMQPIPDYPEYYATISGKIWSDYMKRYMKSRDHGNGYKYVTLYNGDNKRNFYIHRLVWTAFNGNIPEGLQVNHKNEDKGDNRLDNLELLTQKENLNYGTSKTRLSEKRKKNNVLYAVPIILIDVEGGGKYYFHSRQECFAYFNITKPQGYGKLYYMRENKSNRIKIHGIEYIVKEA